VASTAKKIWQEENGARVEEGRKGFWFSFSENSQFRNWE
jgi:hypothetical protein